MIPAQETTARRAGAAARRGGINHGLPRIGRIATDVFILNPCSSVDYSPSCSWRLSIIAVLRYVDPCRGLPCCARRPFPAERRPKFISVTVDDARASRSNASHVAAHMFEVLCAPGVSSVRVCSNVIHRNRRTHRRRGVRACTAHSSPIRGIAPPGSCLTVVAIDVMLAVTHAWSRRRCQETSTGNQGRGFRRI